MSTTEIYGYRCIGCGRWWFATAVDGVVPYEQRPPRSCPDCDQLVELEDVRAQQIA